MRYLLILLFIMACSKEEFTSIPRTETPTVNQVQVSQDLSCVNHSYINPPVDILYVIDNTQSASYLSSNVKNGIRNTISSISQEFDLHLMVAPLLPSQEENLTHFQIVTSSWDSLENPTSLNIVSPDQLELFQPVTGNNQEYGFQRVIDIINANKSNKVFRENAYTIVVMVSNGDDNSVIKSVGGMPAEDTAKYDEFESAFKKFSKKSTDSTLNSEQFRFFSLVTFSTCESGAKRNVYYKRMSQDLYSFSGATDQDSRQTVDSYDICQGNYTQVFNGVNNSIRQLTQINKYNYWLVTSNKDANIETNDIQVTKVSSNGSRESVPQDAVNGFEYAGHRIDQYTRYEPTPGDPQTGLFIKLNGTARVNSPDCLLIKTRTPTEYYGYIVLKDKPVVSSIAVKIRNENIAQSSSNGWVYEGYKESQNIKIPGPNGESDQPAINKGGYFIKLNGDAIYSSGDKVEVFYDPAPIES